ncbi:hypothetical protein JCM10213_003345 [Rhodosporidiobolus nylandii]
MSAPVGLPTAQQDALAALNAFASLAAKANIDPAAFTTVLSLVQQIRLLLPLGERKPSPTTPPTTATTPTAADESGTPPPPSATSLRPPPPHLPAKPTYAAVLDQRASEEPLSMRPPPPAPAIAANDKFASQVVLSVRTVPMADQNQFDVPPPSLLTIISSKLRGYNVALRHVRRLSASGDLLLAFSSPTSAATALKAASEWLPRLHPNLTVATPHRSHALVFHGVLTGIPVEDVSAAIANIAGADVVSAQRIRSRKEGAAVGSVKVVLRTREGVRRVLEKAEEGPSEPSWHEGCPERKVNAAGKKKKAAEAEVLSRASSLPIQPVSTSEENPAPAVPDVQEGEKEGVPVQEGQSTWADEVESFLAEVAAVEDNSASEVERSLLPLASSTPAKSPPSRTLTLTKPTRSHRPPGHLAKNGLVPTPARKKSTPSTVPPPRRAWRS